MSIWSNNIRRSNTSEVKLEDHKSSQYEKALKYYKNFDPIAKFSIVYKLKNGRYYAMNSDYEQMPFNLERIVETKDFDCFILDFFESYEKESRFKH